MLRRVRNLPLNLQEQTDTTPVRTTRARIIYLKNDHKALMSAIEKRLHDHFAKMAENGEADTPMTNGKSHNDEILSTAPAPQPAGPAFAKVNSVVEGSPADSAGLKAGDEIRNFGYVNSTNHEGLRRVGECVQGNEGVCPVSVTRNCETNFSQRDVLVKVSRPENGSQRRQELQLTLKPSRNWGGRGLLGCHILPL